MLMNTDPNQDPKDPKSEMGEDQGGIAPDQASEAPSDQTPEPSTDFVVAADGQTVASGTEQDSASSPAGEEPQEVSPIGTDSAVSQSDTPQADQQPDPPQVDAQPDALQTDSQPGTAETDPQSLVPQSADAQEDYQFGPQFDASQAGSQEAGGPQFTPLPGAVPVGVQPQPEVPQFGAQPPASQFGGPQGGQNPIPPMPGEGGQAYPAPAPYPAPNPYMTQNPYVDQPPQMAPPIQQDSGKASGLAIASLILAILFWPIGLIVSIISVCLSSGRRNRTSRILSLVALGISLLIFLFNVIIFVVVLHGTVDFFENHIPDLINQSYSQTADDDEQDDDEDWESGLQYSEHAAIDPICDLTNGLEFIA